MNTPKHHNKLKLSFYAIFTFVSLIILMDFVVPGKIINDEIVSLQRERQQYHNAASNHHYSYKVVTNKHEFIITEDITGIELVNKEIEYSVSLVLKEVNWYRLLTSEKKSFSSLRIISGLVLPLMVVACMFVAFRFKKDIGILVFVLQALLIADLIFLLIQ